MIGGRHMDKDALREHSLQTWGSLASGWAARHAFLRQHMQPVDDWIVDRTAPTSGQVVLEVGAGPGDLGHRMAALIGEEGRLISSDFSAEMVEVAQRLGATLGVGNVDYRQLDAEAIDLDDNSVDAVVGRSVYMLVADPAAALSEARRVLRSAGSLVFTTFTSPDRNPWWAVPAAVLVQRGDLTAPQPGAPGVFSLGNPDTVRALVTAAGFSAVTAEPVDFVFRYTDDDDAWNAIVDLNGPMAVIVHGLPPDERAATRRAVLGGFERFRDADGTYRVPAQALAVHAR